MGCKAPSFAGFQALSFQSRDSSKTAVSVQSRIGFQKCWTELRIKIYDFIELKI
ncbi:hypothetical protein [uncultured Campylobacter sp.]|uniref:hypothetical protein n=1 Tax=uncultured Campylobacter sp. TaxID=218934 RepID=UPI00262DC8F1|nr:hypothetical protein [uncultured Campylobacter sp.]